MSTAVLKMPLLAAVHAALAPLGYRKSGAVFMRPAREVVHLIEIQGANTNLAESARFTVNVGVFAHGLDAPDRRGAAMPSMPAAHWRERLGFLMPEYTDVWWTMKSREEAEEAGRDIAERVARHAIPALKQLHSREALVSLWRSGQSPGLTAVQRAAYLDRLQRQPCVA